MIDSEFWNNKKVFLTGHTGFKGSWLSIWLKKLNVNLKGYSLSPNTEDNLFEICDLKSKMNSVIGDIRNYNQLKDEILNFEPEIVIHMAAQPLVRYSYENPIETYSTNVMGTLNLLDICKNCKSIKSILVITTDKCYENIEIKRGYSESDPMGGYDPYSSSKGCCELLVSSFRRSYFNKNKSPGIATARAGNVVGGGDWSKDRLLPDILQSFKDQKEIKIRNPKAIRPWQHVLEPLSAYLILTEMLYKHGDKFSGPWNFGPYFSNCKSVEDITKYIQKKLGGDIDIVIDSSENPHEANLLMLDIKKAINNLEWKPKMNINNTIDLVLDWYKSWLLGKNMLNKCSDEIDYYLTL